MNGVDRANPRGPLIDIGHIDGFENFGGNMVPASDSSRSIPPGDRYNAAPPPNRFTQNTVQPDPSQNGNLNPVQVEGKKGSGVFRPFKNGYSGFRDGASGMQRDNGSFAYGMGNSLGRMWGGVKEFFRGGGSAIKQIMNKVLGWFGWNGD